MFEEFHQSLMASLLSLATARSPRLNQLNIFYFLQLQLLLSGLNARENLQHTKLESGFNI